VQAETRQANGDLASNGQTIVLLTQFLIELCFQTAQPFAKTFPDGFRKAVTLREPCPLLNLFRLGFTTGPWSIPTYQRRAHQSWLYPAMRNFTYAANNCETAAYDFVKGILKA
jgi:hypothetical protein